MLRTNILYGLIRLKLRYSINYIEFYLRPAKERVCSAHI